MMRQLLDSNLKVCVYRHPIDMRKSYDSLFALVKAKGIFQGAVFLFLAKNRRRAKVLLWNKGGLMIIMQRMEYSAFADLCRRTSISRDELFDFFEGSKNIRRIDIEIEKDVAYDRLTRQHQCRYETNMQIRT